MSREKLDRPIGSFASIVAGSWLNFLDEQAVQISWFSEQKEAFNPSQQTTQRRLKSLQKQAAALGLSLVPAA
jgi:hypothetical protein